MLNQDEVSKRTGVGDDDRARSRSAWRVSQLGVPLLTQLRAGLALALELVERVLERHAVTLQHAVQVVARVNIEQLAQLVAGNPVHPVGIDRQRLARGSREILTRVDESRGDVVRRAMGVVSA